MSDFFITLVSNGSMNVFPENKTSSFTVLLPEKISLKGEWMVGVAELHYNYNFFNVNEQDNKIRVVADVRGNNTNEVNQITDDKIHQLQVVSGYYNSVTDLIEAVNQQLSPYLFKNAKLLSVDKASNRTLVHRP